MVVVLGWGTSEVDGVVDVDAVAGSTALVGTAPTPLSAVDEHAARTNTARATTTQLRVDARRAMRPTYAARSHGTADHRWRPRPRFTIFRRGRTLFIVVRREESQLVPSKWTTTRLAKIAVWTVVIIAMFVIFNTVFAIFALALIVLVSGRLNIMHGKLITGGLFGCDHTFAPKPGLAIPQCTKCGQYMD